MMIIGEILGAINAGWQEAIQAHYTANEGFYHALAFIGLGVIISIIWDAVAHTFEGLVEAIRKSKREICSVSFDPASGSYDAGKPALSAKWNRCSKNNQNMIVTIGFAEHVNVDWLSASFDCEEIYKINSEKPDQENNTYTIVLNGCPSFQCTFRFYYDKAKAGFKVDK